MRWCIVVKTENISHIFSVLDRNVCNYLPLDMAQHSGSLESSDQQICSEAVSFVTSVGSEFLYLTSAIIRVAVCTSMCQSG